LERRSPDRHARRSAPRTWQPQRDKVDHHLDAEFKSRRGGYGLERRLQPAQPAAGGRSAQLD
ncbi:MAG: hypothetical protein OXH05_02280, partial [Acidobacteria bacterium]|nr:hypothetical protein [Acidobacteriota bacterium]